MKKIIMKKIVASVVGLPVAGVVSATKIRFAPWVNHFLNPQLKEVRMLKKIQLLMSSVLLAHGLWVTSVLAQEMTFWSRSTNAVQLRALVDGWNKTHETQIKLNVMPSAEFRTKIAIAMAAGTPPDIAAIDSAFIPKFNQSGHLLDITDKAKALPYFKHFIKADIETATYPKVGGRLYGLPFFLDNSVLVYNKDLFRRAGIDPENPPLSNRAELKEAIEKVSALGDDIYGWYFSAACGCAYTFVLMPHVWASGGDWFNEDASAATFDDPEIKAAFEFFHWTLSNGHIPPSAEADTGAFFVKTFMSGKIGMQVISSTMMSLITNDAPDVNFGIAYIPGREGGVGAWVGGDSIAIPKGSKHPDEAWEFLEWMTSEEVQLEYYAGLNYTPIRTDLWDPEKVPFFKKDVRFEIGATAAGFGKVPWMIDLMGLIGTDITPWQVLAQSAVFDGEYDGALEEAQKEANKILAESR